MRKVSIIVTAYNREMFIEECIDSILGQTYKNFELIIVDDGSDDNTVQLIREYLDRDKRVKLIKCAHGGVSSARNIGVEHATGDYITFVDSDDTIENTFVENLVKDISKENVDLAIRWQVYQYSQISDFIRSYLTAVRIMELSTSGNSVVKKYRYIRKIAVAHMNLLQVYTSSLDRKCKQAKVISTKNAFLITLFFVIRGYKYRTMTNLSRRA